MISKPSEGQSGALSGPDGRRLGARRRSPTPPLPQTPAVPKRAGTVDFHVGARVRLRRQMLGLTVKSLAEALGLNPQQVQKYETGVNRIGASRLVEIANALGVPVSYFFEGIAKAPATVEPSNGAEVAELVSAYYRITDPELRRTFLAIARRLGRPRIPD